MSVPFSKPWIPISDQLTVLEARGLTIPDRQEAEAFLRHLNYYRFGGYALAFEAQRHSFRPGTTFNSIRAAYEFDRDLRDLITESLEVIELDLRSAVASCFGGKYGPFGHADAGNYFQYFNHGDWLQRLHAETQRSKEEFVKHFRSTYSEYPNLPIWVATEVMSFGALSRMYSGMLKSDQKAVATRYGVQPQTLKSWMHHLVYTRNLCAHHLRAWDRRWAIKPDVPAGNVWKAPMLANNRQLFAALLVQAKMLAGCPAENVFGQDWRNRVEGLIDSRAPNVPDASNRMGLPNNWKQHPVWSLI